jgi:two-component system cell cycle response regulator DivK
MSKRILVVEDQADNREIIRDMLAPTDYEITEVESGEEAIAAVAKQRPDLILMDIKLPIMDGYTATSKIKSDPAMRSIPIIAVTSYALSGEEKKAREAGRDDYVAAHVNYWRRLGNTCPKAVVSETRDQSRQKALNRSGANAVQRVWSLSVPCAATLPSSRQARGIHAS